MKKIYFFVLTLLFIHLFFLFNLQFTAWPEITSFPYLFNNHFKLYSDFIYPYPPLLVWSLSILYKFFGYNIWTLKIFSWSLILTNDILIFLIAKKISKNYKAGILSLASYVFLQPFLEGNTLWFDTAIVTPILFAIYYLLPKQNLLLVGLFLSLAALIKQTAGLYLIFIFVFLLTKKTKPREIFKFLIPPLTLGFFLLIYLISKNSLIDFYKWVLWNPTINWSHFPGYVQMSLSGYNLKVLILLFLPLIFTFRKKNFLLIFLILSLISVYPRFSFFHFQTSLALLCIFYGLSREALAKWGLLFFALILIIVLHKLILIRQWRTEPRFWSSSDIALAQIISSKVHSQESVFLLGLHSGLYSLANRLPPSPWTDNFGWYLEISGVQESVIVRWTKNPPSYIIWSTPKPGNWYDLGSYQPKYITNWIESNYTKKEEIQKGVFIWQKNEN